MNNPPYETVTETRVLHNSTGETVSESDRRYSTSPSFILNGAVDLLPILHPSPSRNNQKRAKWGVGVPHLQHGAPVRIITTPRLTPLFDPFIQLYTDPCQLPINNTISHDTLQN